MNLLSPKKINCSAKYIKFNEIKSKVFLDALSKSDARWDRKQDFFYLYGLMGQHFLRYMIFAIID